MKPNQPPMPPEFERSQPLAPDAGELNRHDDLIEIEIPVDDEQIIAGGSSGCVWGCGGAMGCLVLIVALLAGVLLVGVQSVQGIVDDVTQRLSLPQIDLSGWNEPAPIIIPDNVYVPPVERVRALAQLTTTRYNYSHIVTSQRNMPQWLATLYGDGLIMVAVGHIDAGLDVSQITADDIAYDEASRTLQIRLPQPTLQSCFLNEADSYIVERNTALFAQTMPDLEDSARQYAVRQFRDLALEEGILDTARQEAQNTLQEIFGIIAGTDVTVVITFDESSSVTEFPETCR